MSSTFLPRIDDIAYNHLNASFTVGYSRLLYMRFAGLYSCVENKNDFVLFFQECVAVIDKVIGQLLELIETSVINNSRQSNQYFEFFQKFACIVSKFIFF